MKPGEDGDSDGTQNGVGKAVVVAAGAGVGAWAGAGIGIAGAFGAISGIVPLALLGAYVAHKLVSAKAADELGAGVKQGYVGKSEELKAARAKLAAARNNKPIPIRRRPKP